MVAEMYSYDVATKPVLWLGEEGHHSVRNRRVHAEAEDLGETVAGLEEAARLTTDSFLGPGSGAGLLQTRTDTELIIPPQRQIR